MVRIWIVAALAAGLWLLSTYGTSRPAALGLEAPATQFSAARALATLGRVLGPQKPHPAGSAENEALHARLRKELDMLGVHTQTVSEMSCFAGPRWSVVECATISNIVAGVSPGPGKQILLVAHMDSPPAGPGACDDGCGVATLLETIRALKARGLTGTHPIVALFSDGEEAGLLGAAAYLRDPMVRARTGIVVNVEARGNSGPSLLFQTSPGDARLIDLYAGSAHSYATSSLYAEIYKYLPNDTDLTPALQAGLPGYNFAFIGGLANYHTATDRMEHIDPRSLQHQGDSVLELTDALARTDLDALKDGDAIYLDILGRWLPRLPERWALPLSLAAFAAIALAGFLTRRERREIPRPFLALVMPPLLLIGCVGLGFGLHGVAAWLSGNADPSWAYPVWLRWSLGLGAFAVALLASRGAGAVGSWLWFAGLAVACALWAPGVTPYFLYPALVAAPLLLVTVQGGREAALWIAGLAGALIWVGFAALGELLMGLKLHELFMVGMGFGFLALLPLLARDRSGALAAAAAALAGALVLAAVAGLQPAYSRAAPEPLNIRYVEQDGKAYWLADPVQHLPADLRAAAGFSQTPRQALEPGYVAPIGAARFKPPAAAVSRKGDDVTLDLRAPGDRIALVVPREAGLRAVSISGLTIAAPKDRAVTVTCATPDCADAHMTLTVASPGAGQWTLVEQHFGLPKGGEKLLAARPDYAVPYQGGDLTAIASRLAIPGR